MSNQIALPKKPHLFVGIACHDNRVHSRFMMSLSALVGCGKFKLTISNVSGGGIHKARNQLGWEFTTKALDADIYLSLDSDVEFKPEHIEQLVYDLHEHSLDMVAAPYCHKKSQLEWSARSLAGVNLNPETGLQEMCAVGTGCIAIRRSTFEKMAAHIDGSDDFPHRWTMEDWNDGRGQKKYDFFWEGAIKDPEFGYPEWTQLTEDWGFCYWARKAGLKVWLDTRFYLTHWEGNRGYPEEPPKLLSPEEVKQTK